MIRTAQLRAVDLLLSGFAAVALIVMATGGRLGDRPAFASIPDRDLDRIRGANPQLRQVSGGDCTRENVRTLTQLDPPGVPSLVAWSDCSSGAPGVTPCIRCKPAAPGGADGVTYNLVPNNGGQQWANPQSPVAVDCTPYDSLGAVQSTQGTCMVDGGGMNYCGNLATYTCSVYGIKWNLQ